MSIFFNHSGLDDLQKESIKQALYEAVDDLARMKEADRTLVYKGSEPHKFHEFNVHLLIFQRVYLLYLHE